ncbi:transcription antiterminator lact [Companilactobacillus crustorum]|uniref:Transcription antiterminator lacT n=3 Tax=Companilactobacillus TaxID=2767879 RepID=A0A837RJI7_9LACO|nr:PRD domain-containing protein [Companilactobacillus crustorum]HCD08679.1 PRD domain-containing protein [Lactobacillus sp.]KRK43123.1 transcription antiterminator lacT [Companilactobacillus crustorum JCM 15951]KRO20800.1 transcription antiterminator lacT [Companilactobacillus crustorum]WDT66455.1 PRD domain-containing protein [Companilactobacillus crustorum]GEO76154.1 transcription antiterminator lact [Companilactobacillus crustorum]
MVEIAQIFNNNSALVNLGDHKQAIVKGKGIAFNKSKGSNLETNKIEKIFYLNTKASRENLFFLMKDIPIDVVTTTYEIIDYAKRKFHYNVLDYVYITLSDHIYGAYQRYLAHSYEASLVPDMSNQYTTEYLIASHGLDIINANLNVNFPESEIKSIALHFINAKGEEIHQDSANQTEAININKIVKTVLTDNAIFRKDGNGNYYDRFMIHLQYLTGRLDDQNEDNEEFNQKLEDEMKTSYPRSFKIADEIYDRLQNQLDKKISSSELLYFIIHIQRLTKEKITK